jgi:two-component system sensor histidine kinase AlgZ
MRPHSLFNSMNTIASLTRTSPEMAEKAVEDLAGLFCASLGHQDEVRLMRSSHSRAVISTLRNCVWAIG